MSSLGLLGLEQWSAFKTRGVKSNISWSVPPCWASAQILLFSYLQDSPICASLKLLLLCLNRRFCKNTKWETAYVKNRIPQTWLFGHDGTMLFVINAVVPWQGKLLQNTNHIIVYFLLHIAWPQSNASFCFFAPSRKFHSKVTFSLNSCLIFTKTHAFNLKTSTSRASSSAKEKSAKTQYN